MIDRLERDGLVERRADPDDRRASRIALTGAGRDVARRGGAVVGALDALAFAGLDAGERRVLSGLLGRVIDAVGAEGDA
jgi:MarR family transcriptional regulator, transcriptional regulator for hemolysin